MNKTNRINKKLEAVLVALVFLAIILIVIAFSVNHLNTHEAFNKPVTVNNCQILGKSYFVYIKDNSFNPNEITAKLCDTITFINQDKYRELRFGEHDNHIEYSGASEMNLTTGGSHSVVLKETGTYKVHDHLQEYVHGSFIVTK